MARQEGTSYITAGQSRKGMAIGGVLYQANVNQTTFNPAAGFGTITGAKVAAVVALPPFTTSTYNIPAGLLNPPPTTGVTAFVQTPLKALRFTAWGSFTGSAGQRIRLQIGGTTVADSTTAVATAYNWFIDAIATKLSATSLDCVGICSGATGTFTAGNVTQINVAVTGLNFGTAITANLVIDQAGTSITINGFQVELMPEGAPEL